MTILKSYLLMVVKDYLPMLVMISNPVVRMHLTLAWGYSIQKRGYPRG